MKFTPPGEAGGKTVKDNYCCNKCWEGNKQRMEEGETDRLGEAT